MAPALEAALLAVLAEPGEPGERFRAEPGRPNPDASSVVIAFKSHQGPDSRSDGISSETAPTLTSASGGNSVPALVYFEPAAADVRHGTLADVAQTLLAKDGGWSLNAEIVAVHPDERGRPVVRRCSVLECERLMGLPDGWTEGARLDGKPLSDGARRQMIGNGWGVPVAAWILERMLEVHRGEAEAGIQEDDAEQDVCDRMPFAA